MSTDHYTTLGVARDATDSQVRQAYRRAAAASHPDRAGGDGELMAAVNRAYSVLSDPARRAHYDRSGADELPAPIEAQARGVLMHAMSMAIDHDRPNVVEACRELFSQARTVLQGQQVDVRRRVAKLTRASGKVRVKGGENLAQMLIDDKLAKANAELQSIDAELQVNDAARRLLEQYEQDTPPEPPAVSVQVTWRTSRGTTTTGTGGY